MVLDIHGLFNVREAIESLRQAYIPFDRVISNFWFYQQVHQDFRVDISKLSEQSISQ
jgi:hypothetical protein